MEKYIIIGDKIGEFDIPEDFDFLLYVYLHCDAEEINGYDCCYGNLPVFSKLLGCHLFPCEVQLQDGNTYDALVIPAFVERRIKALVCLCTDIEGIRHAMFEYYSEYNIDTCMEDSQKKILYEKYPEIFKLIREYNLSR